MMDLGTLTARDNFYTQLLNKSKELIKNGERSILYPTKLAAENPKTGLAIASEGTSVDSKLPWNRTFPKGNIINKGLDISSSLVGSGNPSNESSPYIFGSKFRFFNNFSRWNFGLHHSELLFYPSG